MLLIKDQKIEDRTFQGFDTLDLAIAHWQDHIGLVEFTGREEGDEHIWGPQKLHIPL